jgi:tetratricopeptide (TPR) repeat protein
MVGRLNRRQTWLVALALVAVWSAPLSLLAQGSSGMASGVVKDAKGNPVDGATVVFASAESNRKIETKTNKKGEYFQLGLAPGNYSLSASKGDLASVPTPTRILSDQTLKSELVIVDKKAAASAAAAASDAGKAEAAKVAAFTAAFEAGVAASSAGKHDDAIAKFTEAFGMSATCYDCYNNIGYAYVQKKEYDKAEAAYMKGIEIKPNAASYNGLVSVYTATKKLDQASAASAKATELSATATSGAVGGNADAIFNQGVTLWNSGKIEEAKKQFQAALQANPNHAEAHFQLGMALVNEGNLTGSVAEFETYLKLAPTGPNAATAKSLLDTLKK